MGGEKAGAPGQEKMRRCRWRLNARQAGGVRGSARWGASARLTHAPAGAMPAVRVHCSAVFGCRKNHKPGQAPAQSASTQGITPGWTLAERSSHIPPAASAGGAAGLGRFRRRVLGDSGGGCNGWGSWAAHPGTDVGGFCGTRYLQARPCASQRSPQAITGQANHSSLASRPANHLAAMVNPTPGWEGPRRRQQEPKKQDRWTAIQWASAEAAESITTPPHPIQLAAVLRVQFPLATLMDERQPSPPSRLPGSAGDNSSDEG